ncbi:MAG: hypothetical protein MUO26_14885 [Methanotrichaceae archaeon]|nr:hypothetical protein [Methanotrichaceae archaeon]
MARRPCGVRCTSVSQPRRAPSQVSTESGVEISGKISVVIFLHHQQNPESLCPKMLEKSKADEPEPHPLMCALRGEIRNGKNHNRVLWEDINQFP